MKAKQIHKQIRRDCLTYMKGVSFAQFLTDLSIVLVPTLTASVLGAMTDALLQASYDEVYALLPRFIGCMALSVFTVPLFTMMQYLSMGKRGYDYDMFLVNRLFHQPLSQIQRLDIGDVLERLEGTIGDFSWNTAYLFSLPFSVLGYAAGAYFLLRGQGLPFPIVLTILVIPCLPVLKAQLMGKEKAEHERKASEFKEKRKTEEMNVGASKAFLHGYQVEDHASKILRVLFQQYMNRDGNKKIRFHTKSEVLDYLLRCVIPLLILTLGMIFAQDDAVSPGAIVTGYLILPSIERCYTYISKFVEEMHASQEYYDRLSIFYGETEPEQGRLPLETDVLIADGISFFYDASREAAVANVSITLSKGDRTLLYGPNGCGKSTLSRLLAGLYQPASGTIRAHDGTALNVIDLRRIVTIQEQNSAIFHGTIQENLFLSQGQVLQAQRMLHDFGLSKGLDYVVENEGANLSPGEKKKVQLIRVLLRNTPFYLFDEPLNHLDVEGKQALEQILTLISEEHGMMVVSHRDMAAFPLSYHQKIGMANGSFH